MPPAALAELVRVRDRECRIPGCHRPTQHSDLDHATEWSTGGTTTIRNLVGLCRRHHHLKDHPGWHFTLNPHGQLTITTPTNTRHTSTSTPLTEQPTHPAPF